MDGQSVSFVLPQIGRRPVGGYQVVYEYAGFLAARGVDVRIFHFDDLDTDPDGAFTDRRTRSAKRLATRVETWVRGGPRWFDLHPDVRVVAKKTADVSLLPHGPVIATAWQTARFVAEAARVHGTGGYYFVQHFESWSADSAAQVNDTWRLPLTKIVIAPWLLDHAHTIGEDGYVVKNAVSADAFPPGEPQTERARRVVALASENSYKRLDVLVEVFDRVHRLDPGVELVAFGVAARPESLPDFVTYHREPSVPDLFRSARVYFCASDNEGWHLPAAEALMSGAAVVSSECGGVRAYADGIARFRDPDDVEGLAGDILGLVDDPATAQRLAALGRTRLVARPPEQAAAEFAEIVLAG